MKNESGPASKLTMVYRGGELIIHSSQTGTITDYPITKAITDKVPQGRVIHRLKGIHIQRLEYSTMEDGSLRLTVFGTQE
jgi:hypothetical protein